MTSSSLFIATTSFYDISVSSSTIRFNFECDTSPTITVVEVSPLYSRPNTCQASVKPSILSNQAFVTQLPTYIIELTGPLNFTMNLFTGIYTCDDYLPTFTITATKVGLYTPETLVFLNYIHLGDGTANYSI